MVNADILISRGYYDEFKTACDMNAYRTTLAYIGLDLIIDAEGNITCIEINGQNAGTKGFKEAYGEDFARERVISHFASFGLPVTIYDYSSRNEERNACTEKYGVEIRFLDKILMSARKKSMGISEASDKEYYHRVRIASQEEIEQANKILRGIIGEEMGEMSSEEFELNKEQNKGGFYGLGPAEGVIWNNTGERFTFDWNRYLIVNPRVIERLTCDKFLSMIFMPGGMVRSNWINKFNATSFRENSLAKLFKSYRGAKVVFKPAQGFCGKGVVVLDKARLVNSDGKFRKDLDSILSEPESHFDDENLVKQMNYLKAQDCVVVQPYIKSKAFYSPKTGKDHSGSIRYIATVHSHNGHIDINHVGAYARLAPDPISESHRSNVANLSTGAHAAPVSKKDLRRMVRWVDRNLTQFYRRALRVGEFGHKDPVNDYIYYVNYSMLPQLKNLLDNPWKYIG